METPILQTKDLKLYYGNFQALKGISIIGPSGCGKSTFLKVLNRMNDPELVPGLRIEGEALYRGMNLLDKSVDNAERIAQELGNRKCANLVLSGSMVKALGMDDVTDWEAVVAETVPEKLRALNLRAFRAGFAAV